MSEDKPKDPALVLAEKLFRAKDKMAADYRSVIGHTGGILTTSMTFAYSKALNDAIKFLTKEIQVEKK